ncbi:uncharacterized protein LOC123529547 [Mercenaria mercenaria]|uniref:uncharacterized protein LOC123529547 n=1 Tax=Mercenaria mercenaria TaxID=6596 RepID=UPI00234EAF1A|nr:uncharacterized protein LOC123529547 [Mercenaria mercenaria]
MKALLFFLVLLFSSFWVQSQPTVDVQSEDCNGGRSALSVQIKTNVSATSRRHPENILCIPCLAQNLVNLTDLNNIQKRQVGFRSINRKEMLSLFSFSESQCSLPPNFTLSNQITVLDLSDLGLSTTSFGSWKYFHNLTHIYLKNNVIKNLQLHDFKELNNLETLDLSNNQIKQIDLISSLHHFDTHLKRLVHVDLRGNPIFNFTCETGYAVWCDDPHIISFDYQRVWNTSMPLEYCSSVFGSNMSIIINTDNQTQCNCGNLPKCMCTKSKLSAHAYPSVHLSLNYDSDRLSVNIDLDKVSKNLDSDQFLEKLDSDQLSGQLLEDSDFLHFSVYVDSRIITLKMSPKTLLVACFLMSCVFLTTGVILFIYCWKRRRKQQCQSVCMNFISCCSNRNDFDNVRKGVFLVSSEKDNEVLLTFASELEKRNIETVFDERDFAQHAGKNKMSLIYNSINQTCRTIFLISKSFLCDTECVYILNQAKGMEMTQNRFVIIIMKLKDHLNEEVCALHKMFVNNIYLDYPPPPDKADAFWDKLIQYINDIDTHVHVEKV